MPSDYDTPIVKEAFFTVMKDFQSNYDKLNKGKSSTVKQQITSLIRYFLRAIARQLPRLLLKTISAADTQIT
jgi:hypothetical protein